MQNPHTVALVTSAMDNGILCHIAYFGIWLGLARIGAQLLFVSHSLIIMSISFAKVTKGSTYSRQTLAELWGYASFHAIARGVVTPRNDNKIVLFVTEEKQLSAEQYADRLSDNVLEWEGPTDHFAQDRMLNADANEEEIHLFHRERHHSDFTYSGRLKVSGHVLRTNRPSHFKFLVF